MDHKRKERDFDDHGADVVNATLSRLRAQSTQRDESEAQAQVTPTRRNTCSHTPLCFPSVRRCASASFASLITSPRAYNGGEYATMRMSG